MGTQYTLRDQKCIHSCNQIK